MVSKIIWNYEGCVWFDLKIRKKMLKENIWRTIVQRNFLEILKIKFDILIMIKHLFKSTLYLY